MDGRFCAILLVQLYTHTFYGQTMEIDFGFFQKCDIFNHNLNENFREKFFKFFCQIFEKMKIYLQIFVKKRMYKK